MVGMENAKLRLQCHVDKFGLSEFLSTLVRQWDESCGF